MDSLHAAAERKKVLFIRSNPIDPDSRVEKEIAALTRAGYEAAALGWDRTEDHPLRRDELEGGVPVYRVGIRAGYGNGIKNLGPLLRFQWAIARFVRKNRKNYDFIHACDFDTAFTACLTMDRGRQKLVYDIFDYYADAFQVPEPLKKIIRGLDKRLIQAADAVILCSEQRLAQIRGTKPQKLTVIHNAPPQRSFPPASPAPDRLRIAYFGILPAQGRLIRELLELAAEDERLELHIGGFGALEDTAAQYAAEHGNIRFYGKLPYEAVLEAESRCDVLPAIYDPAVANHRYAAPNKFYEALMLGKPVLMAMDSGMSDVAEQQRVGLVFPYGKEGLRTALDRLLQWREDWPEMAERAKRLYSQRYSWKLMEERLCTLYRELEEDFRAK